jgi:hypothetical protein
VKQATKQLQLQQVNNYNNNNKSQRPRCGGSTAAFCLAFFFFILNLFLISLGLFELVERRQSSPVFPARMQASA